MIEHKKPRWHRPRGKRDRTNMIAMCLWDGPRTVSEIEDQFMAFGRRLGFFVELYDQESIERGQLTQELLADLQKMTETCWVQRRDDRYVLTPLGHEEAGKRLASLHRIGILARKLLQPRTVPQVSLGLHLGLALIKLPAGALSGSVGLLSDAADTLLDGLSSILVYVGFRIDRERAVNVVLVIMMLVTGGFNERRSSLPLNLCRW